MKKLNLLYELLKFPIVSSLERYSIKHFVKILPFDTKIIEDNIIYDTKSKIVLVAHYDRIGIALEDYLNGFYLYRKIGMIDHLDGKIVLGYKNVYGIVRKDRVEIDKHLAKNYPMVVYREPILYGDNLYSYGIDNRFGVYAVLSIAKKFNISFVLTAGEETGTTRLEKTIGCLGERYFITIDACYSTDDPHNYIAEDDICYRAIEGGGKGNIAPAELVKMMNIKEKHTWSENQISDATTFYRYGAKAINICYPVRYLHGLEQTKLSYLKKMENTIKSLIK